MEKTTTTIIVKVLIIKPYVVARVILSSRIYVQIPLYLLSTMRRSADDERVREGFMFVYHHDYLKGTPPYHCCGNKGNRSVTAL